MTNEKQQNKCNVQTSEYVCKLLNMNKIKIKLQQWWEKASNVKNTHNLLLVHKNIMSNHTKSTNPISKPHCINLHI